MLEYRTNSPPPFIKKVDNFYIYAEIIDLNIKNSCINAEVISSESGFGNTEGELHSHKYVDIVTSSIVKVKIIFWIYHNIVTN